MKNIIKYSSLVLLSAWLATSAVASNINTFQCPSNFDKQRNSNDFPGGWVDVSGGPWPNQLDGSMFAHAWVQYAANNGYKLTCVYSDMKGAGAVMSTKVAFYHPKQLTPSTWHNGHCMQDGVAGIAKCALQASLTE